MYYVCAFMVSLGSEKNIRFLGTGITDGLLGVMWVLGNKLQVSLKTANVLNC